MKKLTKDNYEKVIKEWHDGANRGVVYIYANTDFPYEHYILDICAFKHNVIIKTKSYSDILRTVEFVDIIKE